MTGIEGAAAPARAVDPGLAPGAGKRSRALPLELANVSKRFGGTTALDTVDWSVRDGEIHCLIGENGSGKSTLIKVVSGVHSPDSGSRVTLFGKRYDGLSPSVSRALGVHVIYQDLSLFPNLTVFENIAVERLSGRALGFVGKRAMRRRAAEVLDALEHELPLDAVVGTLPVAQRQIVAIGRGLAADARLLFMDEPTASLTRHEVDRLFTLVRRLRGMGVTIVFVSHRLDEIVEIADRVSVLRDGRLSGPFDAAEVSDDDLAELMTGERIAQSVTVREPREKKPLLEVLDAGRRGQFSDVNLELHRGEVLGLTGLLGSGRTELALALFGMNPIDEGRILLDGQPLRLHRNGDAIGAGIAYVSEDRLTLGLNLRQSIADNIALPVLERIADRFGLVPATRRRRLAHRWVTSLEIKTDDVSAPALTLSGGNQQRVAIAKWLATRPRVLILDSPTVGVDIRNKQGIYDLVRSLARDGVAILLISDEIEEVYFNTDRVLHMRAGRIVGTFVPGERSLDELRQVVHG